MKFFIFRNETHTQTERTSAGQSAYHEAEEQWVAALVFWWKQDLEQEFKERERVCVCVCVSHPHSVRLLSSTCVLNINGELNAGPVWLLVVAVDANDAVCWCLCLSTSMNWLRSSGLIVASNPSIITSTQALEMRSCAEWNDRRAVVIIQLFNRSLCLIGSFLSQLRTEPRSRFGWLGCRARSSSTPARVEKQRVPSEREFR